MTHYCPRTEASVLSVSCALSKMPRATKIALLVGLQFGLAALPIGITHAEEQVTSGTTTVHGEADETFASGQISINGRMGMLGDKDLMETPFNTISYTEKQIADQHAQDISDVISASDPSVFTSGVTGENIESITIRGFNTDIGDTMFNGLYGIAPYYRSTPEMYQSIDVLKGPSSLLNGMSPNGSVGGSINLKPKRAGNTPNTSLSGTYMSESQYGVHGDIGRRFGDNEQFGIRVNGMLRDGDSAIDGQDKQAQMVSLGFDWRGDNALLETDFYMSEEHVNGPTRGVTIASGVDVPPPPDADTLLNPDWSFNDEKDKGMMIRGELNINEHITTYAAAGASRTEFESNAVRTGKIINNAGDLETTLGYVDLNLKRYSGEVGIRTNFETGSIGHELVINSTYYREDKEDAVAGNRTPEPWVTNIYNPVWGPSNSNYEASFLMTTDATLVSYGIADTLSFADDALQITLGIRQQNVDYEFTVFSTEKLNESAYTPAAAILYKLSPSASLYANYAEGLTNGKSAPRGTANMGESFSPQKTKQSEAGIKLKFDDFSHTVSMYETKQPNSYTDPDTTVYSFGGEQRNRGIEWGFYGTILENYSLTGGLAYVDAEITKSTKSEEEGKKATSVPEFQAKLALEWNVPVLRELTLIGQTNYMSKQYIDKNNERSLPGQTIFDVGARYESAIADQKVTWRLAVKNVANKAYWTSTHYTQMGLGAPRTVMLSATVDF